MIKCLKRLYTLLLIGLPIFLTNFSSAGFTYPIADGSSASFITSPYDNQFKIAVMPEWNVSSAYVGNYKQVLYLFDNDIGTAFMFWDYFGLPYLYVKGPGTCQRGHTNNVNEGEITTYFVCDELTADTTTVSNCTQHSVGSGFNNFIINFLEAVKRSDYYYINYTRGCSSSTAVLGVDYCVSSSSIGNSICFNAVARGGGDYCPSGLLSCSTTLNYIGGFVEGDNFTDLNNSLFYFSPSSYSDSNNVPVPDYEFNENDDYTNGEIIEGFNAMGLTDEFCYGGYQINDIFVNGENPENFTGYRWGGGASIFDLWHVYQNDFSGDYMSFIRSFYIAYDTNNIAQFYGYSKAVYGWVNQWFSVSSKGLGFLESTAPMFTLKDVWDYCNLRFYGDPSATYTGNNWDAKFRYNTSGQVNLNGYFNFSGNNNYFSGTLSGFDEPSDFFASLNAIFQGGLQDISSYKVGVLPSYILLFFFAIILIRILSH